MISSAVVTAPLPVVERVDPAIDAANERARRALGWRLRMVDKLGPGKAPSITAQEIIEAVALAFDVTLYALHSPSRNYKTSWPRFAAMKLMRDLRSMSTPQIGAVFRRDHTTAMHALSRANEFYVSAPVWRTQYDRALNTLMAKRKDA